jgi:hypothetical protein
MTQITFIKQGKVIDRKFIDRLTPIVNIQMMNYSNEIAADSIEYEQF